MCAPRSSQFCIESFVKQILAMVKGISVLFIFLCLHAIHVHFAETRRIHARDLQYGYVAKTDFVPEMHYKDEGKVVIHFNL